MAPAQSPIDLHNHSWPSAWRLEPNASEGTLEHLFQQDQSAWFKVTAEPSSTVIVTLTGLSAAPPKKRSSPAWVKAW